MARYIDADKALKFIEETNSNYNWLTAQYNASWVYDFIESQPTADVVTKAYCDKCAKKTTECIVRLQERKAITMSEAAGRIFEEIEREITDALKSNYKVLPLIEQPEDLWNRVNGKIDALRGIDAFIAELKKKYAKGE